MQTDSQAQRDLGAERDREPSVGAAPSAVELDPGVATRAGTIDDGADQLRAEGAALRHAALGTGVKEPGVRCDSPVQRSDSDIARAVENVLEWTPLLPLGAIRFRVDGGWVTLTGIVDWEQQRQLAVDSVRYLLGVVGVCEQIEIQPALSVLVAQSGIEAARQRAASPDAATILAAVQAADISPGGRVGPGPARETAAQSAQEPRGMHQGLERLKLDH